MSLKAKRYSKWLIMLQLGPCQLPFSDSDRLFWPNIESQPQATNYLTAQSAENASGNWETERAKWTKGEEHAIWNISLE